MIRKFLLIFALSELCVCGLCSPTLASNILTIDGKSIFDKANEACHGFDWASDEKHFSMGFAYDIELMISMLNKLEIAANNSGNNYIEKDIKYMVHYLHTNVNFQSTWEIGVSFIRDMTLLMLDNENLNVCKFLVLQAEEWRKENYRIQKLIQSIQVRHQQFSDCLQDAESDSCNYSMALPMVLAAKHDEQTTEASTQKVADFREKYSELQSEFHRSQPSFSEWYLTILWLRSFKLTNYKFNKEIMKELVDRSAVVETAFIDTLRKLTHVKIYFHKIETVVEKLNGGKSAVKALFGETPKLTVRVIELQQLNTFLEYSLKHLRPFCERIRTNLFDEFVMSTKVLMSEQQANRPSRLDQRHDSARDLMESDVIENSASDLNEELKIYLKLTEYVPLNGSSSILIRKEIFYFFVKINDCVISYSKCSKLGLFGSYSLTAIQSDRYLRDEKYDDPYKVVETHGDLNFMNITYMFLTKQRDNMIGFLEYFEKLLVNNDVVDTIVRSTLSTNDVTTFKNLLSKTTENFKDVFDTQCMTSTSMFIGELIKQLSLESRFAYDNFFKNDKKVKTFFTKYKVESIQGVIDRILENTRNAWDSVESIYNDIWRVFDDAYTFISTDYDSSQSSTLEDLLQQATCKRAEISKIKSKSEEYSTLLTYLGPIALKTFSLHFPESPAINLNDIGTSDSRNSKVSAYPFDVNESDIIYGRFNYMTNVKPMADKSRLTKYSTQLDDLSAYSFGADGGHLFQWEACDIYCMYEIELNKLVNSIVSFGFGYFHFDESVNVQYLTGVHFKTPGAVTEDKLIVVIALNVPTKTMNVYYLNKSKVETKYELSGIDSEEVKYYRPLIAFTGSLTFTWSKLDYTIVDYPVSKNDIYEYKLGNVDSKENSLYIMTDVVPKLKRASEQKWFKVPWSSAAYSSTGVAIVTEDLYLPNLTYAVAILFDGYRVVKNPYKTCLYDTSSTSVAGSLTSDQSSTSTTEYLYMGFASQFNVDSGDYELSIQFFKTGMDYVYEVIGENYRLAPSYMAESSGGDNNIEMITMESPPVVPSETRDPF